MSCEEGSWRHGKGIKVGRGLLAEAKLVGCGRVRAEAN